MTANTDIRYLKGVGAKRAEVLKSKGIDTVGALLRFYPRKYLDWTDIKTIRETSFFENSCWNAFQILQGIGRVGKDEIE